MALPSRHVKIYFIIGVCVIHTSFILANRFHAREILQNVQVIWVFWGFFCLVVGFWVWIFFFLARTGISC